MTSPVTPTLPRLAVFLSGSGRTLLNLIQHTQSGSLAAVIALVVASKETAGAAHARARNIPTVILPGHPSAESVQALVSQYRIDYIILAGYLKMMPVPPALRGRILNIHPSLLPRHGGPGMYGDRVHAAVLAAGDTISGCTIHEVTDEYDKGRIILQRTCPVLPGDDAHTLAARVFEQECIAYPEAIAKYLAASR
ncbi:MAG: phosphoribosylglycinamide formyltransferase [Planctomycetes bacterium]|nr:phosphoribosylglycinamide formyltransferase [Planctomycetota bacterium]